MARIAKIVTTWTTSALRCPVAYALTDCGHSARVTLRPMVLRCLDCGARIERPDLSPAKRCDCGCFSFTVEWFPDPHRAEDRITAVGDEVECADCARFTRQLSAVRALSRGAVVRARFRPYDSRGGREGAYHLYERDEGSPSGVRLLLSIDARPEADAALRAIGVAPLSPTERA